MASWLVAAGSLSACSEEAAGEGTGGAGAGNTGTGGATTSSGTGGTGAGESTCHGDEQAWEQIAKGDISCAVNSDCCVVINDCLAEAYVVHADDYVAAQAAWPWCELEGCANCFVPLIDIACVSGVCVGSTEGDMLEPGDSHCGVDPEPLPPGGLEGMDHFTCSGPG